MRNSYKYINYITYSFVIDYLGQDLDLIVSQNLFYDLCCVIVWLICDR